MRGGRVVDLNGGPIVKKERSYPWAWIIVIIIILLIIWAFFGWNNRARVISPVNAPAAATSPVR